MFKNDALKSLQIAINTAFFYPYSCFIHCLPIHISIFITYTYRRNILNCSRCCTMTELFHGCETILTRTTLHTTNKFLTNFPTKNMCYYAYYIISWKPKYNKIFLKNNTALEKMEKHLAAIGNHN